MTFRLALVRTLSCFIALAYAVLTHAMVHAEDASGLKLVGTEPLQGRAAYQVVPHRQGNRWLLYIGHMPGEARNSLTGKVEQNGLSIVDVTDAARPRLIRHEPPGDPGSYRGTATQGGTYHVQACDGSQLPHGRPGKVYVLRTMGEIAREILDVTRPEAPRRVTLMPVGKSDLDGLEHTHKNFWDCRTGLAYMVGSVPGWHAQMILQIFDLSDPENPRLVRNFGLPGMEPGALASTLRKEPYFYGPGAHSSELLGNRLYVAYGPFSEGTLQILDVKRLLKGDPKAAYPLRPTADSLRYPQIGRLDFPSYWGVHTTKPIIGMAIPQYARDKTGAKRDILVTLSEGASLECDRPRHAVFFIDMTQPAYPIPISTYQASEREGHYCDRKVWFGPHNVQASSAPMYEGKLLFVTYFGAGLRVVDIRDPFHPVEVGHYIPDSNVNTRYVESKGPWKGVELERVTLANDVDVDERGYIYVTDRALTGLHILEPSGQVRAIAAAK